MLLFTLLVAATMLLAEVEGLLSRAPGGIVIGGVDDAYTANFGTVNGIGVGAVPAGLTLLTTGVPGGVLYYTPVIMTLAGFTNSHQKSITANVQTNFGRPAQLAMWTCPVGGACTTAAGYSAMSTNPAAPTPLWGPQVVANGTQITLYIALFVADANGPGIAPGPDTVIIALNATDATNGTVDPELLTISVTTETAVSLQVTTAPGGLAISPSADFLANFGNVNGLGVGIPSAGLTVLPSAGGVIYTTPYNIQPGFTGFTSTTGSVSTYVSADFANPAILKLLDSTAAAGPYNNISKLSGTPTVITTTASSLSTSTRYLGLFVSNANSGFPGTPPGAPDSATLTYTLTVP